MINTKKILVGIVLYNPNLPRLQQNIDAVAHEVDSILLVDNASKNINDVDLFAKENKIELICNKKNRGLPHVFNSMISYAQENGFNNLLLLDQDSVFHKDAVKYYREYISSNYVCIVPKIIQRLEEYEKKFGEKEVLETEVEFAINSGTLINLEILPSDIRFNEKLFVDCVDFDFFIQLRKRNLKILKVDKIKLLCDLGNLSVHRFHHIDFFANNYSTFRLEKQARDRVIFLFNHFKNPLAKEVFLHSALGYLMILMFEKQKVSKIFAVIKGFAKGLFTLFR